MSEPPEDDNLSAVEQRILAAARAEFVRFGYKGARMQAIADKAQVNKALLHYYFRSKRKLFEAISADTTDKVWQAFHVLNNADFTILDKLNAFSMAAMRVVVEDPGAFQVFLQELDQETWQTWLEATHFRSQLIEGQKLGLIREVSFQALMLEVLGACWFPAAAPAMVEGLFPEGAGDKNDALRKYYEELGERLFALIRR